MKAVVITAFGEPDVLRVESRKLPAISDSQVLVEVKAAGINRPDIFQRKGHYPAPPDVVQDIPGLEVAGVVLEVGSEVSRWSKGDEVCCLIAGGGYAECVAVEADCCLPIPNGLSFAEAASLPETVFTVWDNVFRRGALKRGEHLLVHGGSGGIGSAAIQLAKACGAQVSTTSGSAEKCAYCISLGADRVINYKEQDFAEVLRADGLDVILDSIAGDYFEKNVALLRPEGRLVHINAVKGKQVSLDIVKLMQKRLTLTGSTLRSRDIEFKAQLAREVQEFIWPLVGTSFKPQVFKAFPYTAAEDAHRLLEDGDVFGKLVLLF